MAGNLWKPVSESDGNLAILFEDDPGTVVIKDSEGNVIATGRNTGKMPGNDGRTVIRFDRPGSSFENVIVERGDGRSFFVGNGGNRHEDNGYAPKGTQPKGVTGNVTEPKDRPTGQGGTGGVGGSPEVGVPHVAPPIPIDPNLIHPFPITPSFIDQANYNFTDPIAYTGEVGAFNREQSALAFETGLSRAKQIQKAELASIIQFAEGISQYQQQLVGEENQFNQQQRIGAAEAAIPGVQDIFERQRGRAETLAEGKLLTTAEDRAFELAAQSASAEGNFVRGFGDDSVVGRTTSEKLSAQQRLGLTQLGENFLSRSLQQAAGVLMDVPLKASISQRLPSQPNVPLAQVAGQQQATETALTTINPQAALASNVQQEQFATSLEQRTNEFNATQDYNSQVHNSNQFFSALQQQLGLHIYNAQQYQSYLQNIYNAEAAANQVQFERDQFNQLYDDFKRYRDRDQLIRGLSTLFGAAGTMPDWVWNALKGLGGGLVNYVAERLGFEPPFDLDESSASSGSGSSGSSSGTGTETTTPESPGREPETTPNPEEAETGGAGAPHPFPGNEEESAIPPEEETAPEPETTPETETEETGFGTGEEGEPFRMLSYNPKTGNYRYRLFTPDMLIAANRDPDINTFASGAVISLTRSQFRELKGLY